MMEYKKYVAIIEFDDEAGLLHGEVMNTRDVITFQGSSVAELRHAFEESVDDYLAFCAERGEQPDKPFSGQFVTRLGAELHREIHFAATRAGQSLNAWVAETLTKAVHQPLAAVARIRPDSRRKAGKYCSRFVVKHKKKTPSTAKAAKLKKIARRLSQS